MLRGLVPAATVVVTVLVVVLMTEKVLEARLSHAQGRGREIKPDAPRI